MDIRLFRTDPDLVRESQRRRFRKVEDVDEVIALDEEWRKSSSTSSLSSPRGPVLAPHLSFVIVPFYPLSLLLVSISSLPLVRTCFEEGFFTLRACPCSFASLSCSLCPSRASPLA